AGRGHAARRQPVALRAQGGPQAPDPPHVRTGGPESHGTQARAHRQGKAGRPAARQVALPAAGRILLMRVVLDTNVWLDWLVFEGRQITGLRAACEAKALLPVIDGPCLEELERVLAYPEFDLDPGSIRQR